MKGLFDSPCNEPESSLPLHKLPQANPLHYSDGGPDRLLEG